MKEPRWCSGVRGCRWGTGLDGDAQHPRQFDLDHDRRQATLRCLRVLWHEEQFVDDRKVAVKGYLQVFQACPVRARELAALGGSELLARLPVVKKRRQAVHTPGQAFGPRRLRSRGAALDGTKVGADACASQDVGHLEHVEQLEAADLLARLLAE